MKLGPLRFTRNRPSTERSTPSRNLSQTLLISFQTLKGGDYLLHFIFLEFDGRHSALCHLLFLCGIMQQRFELYRIELAPDSNQLWRGCGSGAIVAVTT